MRASRQGRHGGQLSFDSALEEFGFKTVLAQGLRAVGRKRGRAAEVLSVGWSSMERSFDRRQAPRHGRNPTDRDSRIAYGAGADVECHRRRSQCELIGLAVAHL